MWTYLVMALLAALIGTLLGVAVDKAMSPEINPVILLGEDSSFRWLPLLFLLMGGLAGLALAFLFQQSGRRDDINRAAYGGLVGALIALVAGLGMIGPDELSRKISVSGDVLLNLVMPAGIVIGSWIAYFKKPLRGS